MKFEELTHKIIGCAIEVHNQLQSGFPECIYQRALAIELENVNINFQKEFDMPVLYKGEKIGSRRVDFFVEDLIPVELKAVCEIDNSHIAQALNYLEAYNLEIGLLINFGSSKLQFKRIINAKIKSV